MGEGKERILRKTLNFFGEALCALLLIELPPRLPDFHAATSTSLCASTYN